MKFQPLLFTGKTKEWSGEKTSVEEEGKADNPASPQNREPQRKRLLGTPGLVALRDNLCTAVVFSLMHMRQVLS